MALPLRTGGEVDAFCTKCRMLLAHTILAMVGSKPVRVQCNTCGGQHNFRGAPDAPAAKSSATRERSAASSEAKAERVRLSFEQQLATKVGAGKTYSPKATFLVDEVVVHPTFGRGYVEAVRGDKVDVVFKTGTRTLVHGRA